MGGKIMNDITKTPADLSKYLDIIFGEEILLNKQRMILQQLKGQEPIREYADTSDEEHKYEARKKEAMDTGSLWLGLGACIGIFGFIPAIILGAVNNGIKGAVVAVVILVVISGIVALYGDEKADDKTAEAKEEYRKQLQKADFQNSILERKYNSQLDAWKEAIQHIEARISEIEKVLTLLYSDNVIYVKYRNLVAISAIKEYVDSGRAKNLLEAYDRFEVEYRLDTMQNTLNRIDDKLDAVLSKLDNITYELSEALRRNNEESKKFRSDMVKYMDTVTYNQKEQLENLVLIKNDQNCIAENTKVLGYIKNTQKRDFDMSQFIKMYNQKLG